MLVSGSKNSKFGDEICGKFRIWELLKKQHSQLAEKVQPSVNFVEQTFDVRLFDDDKNPLNEVTDMLCMINKMGEDG